MRFETFKWLYQRISTPFIIIFSLWIGFEAYQIRDYNYETINNFFQNNINLFFFTTFFLLSLFHTAIEVFHAISDYFSETKNENFIFYLTNFLYLIIILSILIFVFKYVFIQ